MKDIWRFHEDISILKNTYSVVNDVSPLKIFLDILCKLPPDKFLKWIHNTHLCSSTSGDRDVQTMKKEVRMVDSGWKGKSTMEPSLTDNSRRSVRGGIAQWWERSPPTNVARVWFLPICGSSFLLAHFWFSPCSEGFSPGTPVFLYPQKPTLVQILIWPG